MRYLSIDYGEKHIGVALSNEDGTMAFPHASLSNGPGIIDDIQVIATEKKVEAVILGESKDFKGVDNPIMKKARLFAEELQAKTGILVHFEPEFMTSVEARHIQGGGEKTHASAAALILKSFLDRRQSKLEADSAAEAETEATAESKNSEVL